MVDTQQLLAWPVSFSLSAVDLSELDDSSHSLDMKHFSTLDYASISSSSFLSSLSPPLMSSISSSGLTYDPSPPQNEDLTNVDYNGMHSYRTEPDTDSKSSLTKSSIWVLTKSAKIIPFSSKIHLQNVEMYELNY